MWLHSFKSFCFIVKGGWVRCDTGAQKGQLQIAKSTFLNTIPFSEKWSFLLKYGYKQSSWMSTWATLRLYSSLLMSISLSLCSCNRHLPSGLSLHTWGFLGSLFLITRSLWVMESKVFGRRDLSVRSDGQPRCGEGRQRIRGSCSAWSVADTQ